MLDYGFDPSSKDGELKLLSELAARWAETLVGKPKPSWWKRFLQSIKNWIKQFTGKILSENQVDELVGGFVKYGTAKDKKLSDKEIQFSKKEKPTQEVKPEVKELFDSNPELANQVYEALGFNNLIKPTDKIIWGHPAIGKSYAAKKVKMIDFDSYKLGINKKYNLYIAPGLSDTELRTDDKTREARENWRYEKPENAELWNQFIRDTWQQAKKDAKEQGAILFASDLLVLREFGNEVDKALTMPDELFFERSKQRNNFIEGELGTEVWKGNLNKAVNNFKEKFGENKVINTEKYLSDLFITPQQKQQALQLYSQYLDTGKQDIEGFKEFVETRPAVIPKSEYSYLLDEPATPNSSVSNKIDMSKDYQNLEKMYKSLTFEERIKLGSLEDIIAARSNWPEEFIIDWINCNK
jgi:hypothetical protein